MEAAALSPGSHSPLSTDCSLHSQLHNLGQVCPEASLDASSGLRESPLEQRGTAARLGEEQSAHTRVDAHTQGRCPYVLTAALGVSVFSVGTENDVLVS